ncbi:MAG: C4-dicarboxylate TRAP transporter substrate-binding protein [Xanthobacteraceae bacterium]|uniref:C4-dicarboxylate TRAP transporter substrate-binding protein n=1 Tax=Pseudolabrys sp. TaxID=1960880 RepID=UPI003D0E8C96
MIARTLGAALLLTAMTTSAFAQQRVTLTVAAGQPPAALPSLALVNKFFIPEVNKRIKDAKIDFVIDWKEAYAGSLLKPYQMLDGVKDGLADIGFMPTIFFPDKLPLENITLVAPFLTTDIVLLSRVMNRLHDTLPAFTQQYDKFNLVRLGGTGADSFELLTTFPVKSIDDLKGHKIGTAGAALAWLRGTGATPVQSNMMEYYNSAKNGVFEGFIVFPSSFPAMKYPEAAPYMAKVGFGAQYSVVLTMNKDSFKKLPPAVQKIMHEVGREWGAKSDEAYMTAGEKGYKSLDGFKAKLYVFPEEERRKWAFAMPNIAKEWAASMEKQGIPGNQALKALMDEARSAGIKPVRNWDRE